MRVLTRQLSSASVIAIVVGGVIGSGIFMKPSLMASQLGSPFLLLSVWIVAGVITLCGALTNAELACMFPETGGQLVFFRKMYGDRFAFLYGWASFSVFNTAGNASIAFVCATYIDAFYSLPEFASQTSSISFHIPFIGDIFPLKDIGVKLLTVLIVVFLSFINIRGVGLGAGFQRVLSFLKVLAMFLLVAGLLGNEKVRPEYLSADPTITFTSFGFLLAYASALSGAFWAYDGWNNITFVAGEIKEPQKSIPGGLFFGLLLCMLIYFLVNLSYLLIMPFEELGRSSVVASEVASMAWGTAGAILIGWLVILSTFGAANANIMSTARVTFALGEGSGIFGRAAIVDKRFGTPSRALLLNAAWSCILIFSGSFDLLTDMLIFVSWFFYGMSALGVFVLRKKLKDQVRPYKVWGYPYVPFLFVVFTAAFLVLTVYDDISRYRSGHQHVVNSLLGVVIVLIGLPLSFIRPKAI